MHIPDGLLTNKINLINLAISSGLFYFFNKKALKNYDEFKINIAASLTAFVFAAQMLNFPIGFGASGHFLGTFFLMLMLGLELGFISICLILIVQALFFADGGIIALGSNIFNMAIMGGLIPYTIFKAIHKQFNIFSTKLGFLILTTIVSYISVVLAAFSCGLQIFLSHIASFKVILSTILFVHSFIAVGEAIIVFILLSLIFTFKPELLNPYVNNQKIINETNVLKPI